MGEKSRLFQETSKKLTAPSQNRVKLKFYIHNNQKQRRNKFECLLTFCICFYALAWKGNVQISYDASRRGRICSNRQSTIVWREGFC